MVNLEKIIDKILGTDKDLYVLLIFLLGLLLIVLSFVLYLKGYHDTYMWTLFGTGVGIMFIGIGFIRKYILESKNK